MDRFAGKVALITGAASGMGRATTLRLSGEGARVFAIDVDADGLAETLARGEQAGGTIRTEVVDVAERAQCVAAVDGCIAAFGRLDVLANVAGILRMGRSEDFAQSDWEQILAVNLSGPFYLCQAAIPHLLATGGNIVNVASNAGLMGQAYGAAYCASKAGLVNLTRALAVEYFKQGIRVNAVAPGGTDTPMVAGLRTATDLDFKLMRRATVPREDAQPEDIAAAIAFVASDEARCVHGAIWSVDNGLMAG